MALFYLKKNALCSNCDKTSGNLTNFKKHKNNHESITSILECDNSDREFSKKWKRNPV